MIITTFAKSHSDKTQTSDWIQDVQDKLQIRFSKDFLKTVHGLNVRERCLSFDKNNFFKNDDSQSQALPSRYYAKAAQQSLKQAGLTEKNINGIITSTNTPDHVAPGNSSLLMNTLPFDRNTFHFSIIGMGCAGSIVQLKVVADFLKANPDNIYLLTIGEMCSPLFPSLNQLQGQEILSFKEILSQSIPQEQKEAALQKTSSVIQTLLFGDICVSFLAMSEAKHKKLNLKLPYIKVNTNTFHFGTNLNPEDAKAIYFEDGGTVEPVVKNRRIKYHLSKRIPQLVLEYSQFLEPHYKNKTYDKYFVHTGSHKIIQGLQNLWQLQDEQLAEAYSVLENYGNVSQGSIPLMWLKTLEKAKTKTVLPALSVGFGIGFLACAVETTVYG